MTAMEQVVKFPGKMNVAAGSDLCDCHSLAREAWGKRAEQRGSGFSAFAYLWRRFGPPWWGTDSYKRLASYVLTTSEPDVFLGIDVSASSMAYNVSYWVRREIDWELRGSPDEHKKWEEKFWRWFLDRNPRFEKDKKDRTKEAQALYAKWRFESERIRAAEKVIGVFPAMKYGRCSPEGGKWRKGPPVMVRVNQALLDAMKELLRPTHIRDNHIDLFGVTEDFEYEDEDGETVKGWGKLAEPSKYAGLGVPRAAMERLLKSDARE